MSDEVNYEHTRYDRWTEEEDIVLTKIVARFVSERKTRMEAFKQASYRIERTAAACQYRWNQTVCKTAYAMAIMDKAKKKANELRRGPSAPKEEDDEQRYQNRYVNSWSEEAPVEQDERYVEPKEEPRSDGQRVVEAIENNEIYRTVLDMMVKAQQKQVAYGLDKYIETLNPNSWSTIETIDHIISESIDQLHYLVMLKIRIMKTLTGGE